MFICFFKTQDVNIMNMTVKANGHTVHFVHGAFNHFMLFSVFVSFPFFIICIFVA